ncbi:MAG: hypothetical protein OHK0029_41150 [Armatimonadaceae bacterium]
MKLVSTHRRAAWLALILTLIVGGAMPAHAQDKAQGNSNFDPFLMTPLIQQGGAAPVPLRAHPMTGDGTHIPPDVPVRSLQGVKGFDKAGTSRVRIGGPNGATVLEKVVNLTQTETLDERVPVWSPDERLMYVAATTAMNPRYGLFYVASDDPQDATVPARTALTDPANTQFDYFFPAINANGNRIAFVRSDDGRSVDDPAKVWQLYVSDLPLPGQFINTAPLGNTNLRSLTAGRSFPNGATNAQGQPVRVPFTNVGRPSWVGANDVVFAGQLQGDPNFHIFTVNVQTGVIFQLTAGPCDERNPAVSPDGRYIAFDSNAQAVVTGENYQSAPGTAGRRVRSETDPLAVPATGQNATNVRNIFTMTTLGADVRQFTNRYPGAPSNFNSVEPAWSSLERNNFTNVNGDDYYLAFSSNRIPQFATGDTTQANVTGFTTGPANTSSVYYAIYTRNRGTTRLIEAAPTDRNNLDSDGARLVDTANYTLVRGTLNDVTQPQYNDRYPTWAPIIKVFRIGFQSNRNGDYRTNGFGTGFNRTAPTLNNILFASLIDITAPTLVRYDTSNPTGEVVHINLVTDTVRPFKPSVADSVRSRDNGITPGSLLHFAVRVDDREAGLRPSDSTDGGAVYLQFKNPNSKYQSQQQGGNGVEHKEYIGSRFLNLDDPGVGPNWVTVGANPYSFGYEYECQAISVVGAANTFPTDAARGTVYYSHLGNTLGSGPLYLPSVSDFAAFSGDDMPPLDGQNGRQNVWLKLEPLVELNADGTPRRDGNGNTIPLRPSDGSGGVLYGAVWQIPQEASDWYVDVIVYDNAVNPFDATDRSNVIIYDNVWGFSSANPISGQQTDILVVMDYPLGQKFFGTRFGQSPAGTITSGNLQPLFFGAESYFTDIDMSLYPSERFANPLAPPTPGGTDPRVYDNAIGPFNVGPQLSNGAFGGVASSGTPNVLGVESYNDEFLLSSSVVADTLRGKQYQLPITGRYNIWRVLSRGPVPGSVLRDYLPQVTTSPADIAVGEENPRTLQHSTRFVVWASPFSGNLFVGPGTITDIQTQTDLENFVTSGGRLFISGQDIGWALVGQGQTNRFFSQILKARYLSDTAGAAIGLNAADTTIAGNYIGQIRRDPWNPAGSAAVAFGRFSPPTPFPYTPLDENSQGGVDVPYQNGWAAGPVGDASPTASSSGGRPDIIQANPSTTPAGLPANTPPDATDEWLWSTTPGQPTLAGPGVAPTPGNHFSAIITASYPVGTSAVGVFPEYNPSAPFVPQGKVVYSAAGFESIGYGWYSAGDPARILTFGRRAELMFAIGSLFRTGTITGRIIDNDGTPVGDALVRAIPNVANDALRAAGTAVTDQNGNFQIVGLQPGFYVIYGYRSGFYTQHNTGNTVHGGWRSQAELALKKATPGALSGIRSTQNQSFGGVFTQDGNTAIAGVEIQVRRLEPNGRYSLVATLSSNGQDPVRLPDGTLESLPAGAYRFPTLAVVDPRFGYQVLANARTTVNAAGEIVEKQTQTFTDPNTGEQFQAHVNFDGTPVLEQYGEVRVGVSPQDTFQLGPGTVVVPNNGLPIGPTLQIRESETAQVNFLLPSAPQQVTGQVVDQESNEPISGAIITATAPGSTTLVASGTTDENGNYTLAVPNPAPGQDPTLIPGGTYVITANANGFSTAVPPSEVNGVQVVVGGTRAPIITVPQIRLQRLPPGSVSGLVRRFNGANLTTSGVGGATVSFYAVTDVGGTQVQAENPSFVATVSETVSTDGNYQFNYRIENVSPGTYNAYVSRPGLTGNPSPFANVTITTGQETRSVNFQLQPPKIYGEGIQLISVPQDFSAVATPNVFGYTANGDNNGDGVVNSVDQQIFQLFNVADWTGTEYRTSPTLPLRLGKGYFVRFGSVAAVTTVGTPTEGSTFTIDLSTGWNLIGHPFSNQENVSDPASAISINAPTQATYSYTALNGQQRSNVSLQQAVADGALQSVMFEYNTGQYNPTGIMKQWFGYWFRAFVPVQMTLRYPGAGSRATRASNNTGGKFRSVTTEEREAPQPRAIVSKALNDWRIQIAAQQGDLRDTENAIGVAPDAADNFDNRYDVEKPPMITQVPSLYVAVQGNNNEGRSTGFADNVQAANGQKKTWTFTVETTGGNGEVTVFWPNISRLPRGIEPILVDEATGKRVPMRSISSFRFAPSGRSQRKFRVEVAPATSLPLDIMNLRSVPSRSLRGVTYRFNFITTRSVDVDAEVKTLTGRTVKRFRSRATGGTDTSLVWDGRDEAGSLVPPGPYVLSISAQDDRGSRVNRSVPFMTVQ